MEIVIVTLVLILIAATFKGWRTQSHEERTNRIIRASNKEAGTISFNIQVGVCNHVHNPKDGHFLICYCAICSQAWYGAHCSEHCPTTK